jgi:hypothetical protein
MDLLPMDLLTSHTPTGYGLASNLVTRKRGDQKRTYQETD